jgi:hypothetical protein
MGGFVSRGRQKKSADARARINSCSSPSSAASTSPSFDVNPRVVKSTSFQEERFHGSEQQGNRSKDKPALSEEISRSSTAVSSTKTSASGEYPAGQDCIYRS